MDFKDNFFKDNENDQSLSLENSFKDDYKQKNDDFGGLLNDPEDIQQETGRDDDNQENEEPNDEDEDNPCNQVVSEVEIEVS